MCKFKSGIILKNKVVLAPIYNDSHSALLNKLGIEDSHLNASKTFVRAELVPPNGNKTAILQDWKFIVDQDITPDWFDIDKGRYENEFRNSVKEFLETRMVIMAGKPWFEMKREGEYTYYLLGENLFTSEFGKTNNYGESMARRKLLESKLYSDMRNEYGDRLVPITLDLTSLDGFKDYGKVEGDYLAIPTLDLYRECHVNIPQADTFWLSTPDSTPSGCGSGGVCCVNSDGDVRYYFCRWCHWGVRPFCILQS